MEVELETVGSTVVSDRRQNACASKLCQRTQYLTRVLQIPTDTCEKPVGGYLTLTQGFMTLVNSKRTIIAASREITFDVKGTHRMSTRRSMAGVTRDSGSTVTLCVSDRRLKHEQ